jgi:hypothetical protein
VLGGLVVTELDAQGRKAKGYVYLGGDVIAEQGVSTLALSFRHDDPLTGSRAGSAPDGVHWKAIEADPEGVNVGVADPLVSPEPEGFAAQGGVAMLSALAEGGCSAGNPACRRCALDGFEMDCERVSHLIEIGAAVACPEGDCGARVGRVA